MITSHRLTASIPCQLNVIASFAPAGTPPSSNIMILARIISANLGRGPTVGIVLLNELCDIGVVCSPATHVDLLISGAPS